MFIEAMAAGTAAGAAGASKTPPSPISQISQVRSGDFSSMEGRVGAVEPSAWAGQAGSLPMTRIMVLEPSPMFVGLAVAHHLVIASIPLRCEAIRDFASAVAGLLRSLRRQNQFIQILVRNAKIFYSYKGLIFPKMSELRCFVSN